jgi:hypothetical protein
MKQIKVLALALALAMSAQELLCAAASGAVISGVTTGLEDNEILVGVEITAFQVLKGNVRGSQIGGPAFSRAGGKYDIDVGNNKNVVLHFFLAGRTDLFLPQAPAGNVGGALHVTNDITGLDVALPEIKCVPASRCARFRLRRCH